MDVLCCWARPFCLACASDSQWELWLRYFQVSFPPNLIPVAPTFHRRLFTLRKKMRLVLPNAALAAVLSFSLNLAPAPAPAITGDITGDVSRRCSTISTPSATTVTCLGFGLSPDGRIGGCASDEACIATSAVRNPSKYGPPWRPVSTAEAADTSRAWRSIVAAVQEEPGLTIVDQNDQARYLRASGKSTIPSEGTDDVEFVLRDGNLLYRSATRQSLYLYPLQQPVDNQLSHNVRLSAIRARLGWEEAGLPTDGEGLADEMSQRYGVPTAKRWFGLELGGMRVDEDVDTD